MIGSLRRASLLTIAALAFAAGAPPAWAANPAMTSAASRPMRDVKRSLFGGIRSSTREGRKGARITAVQQKRISAKKRNVARNRRQHR